MMGRHKNFLKNFWMKGEGEILIFGTRKLIMLFGF